MSEVRVFLFLDERFFALLLATNSGVSLGGEEGVKRFGKSDGQNHPSTLPPAVTKKLSASNGDFSRKQNRRSIQEHQLQVVVTENSLKQFKKWADTVEQLVEHISASTRDKEWHFEYRSTRFH